MERLNGLVEQKSSRSRVLQYLTASQRTNHLKVTTLPRRNALTPLPLFRLILLSTSSLPGCLPCLLSSDWFVLARLIGTQGNVQRRFRNSCGGLK
ncbi:hypothetical protein E2C01_003232 [Portunus trituberculatus]|uniref:Uncharacterized protein n=1 Tax=Portunus trituberculatus TaxID=210409 RepID=A0A5B7CN59_PORTR|nr:hypothetical protein [Portunus trituberculatus]